jgi:protein-serine/threonine kinase
VLLENGNHEHHLRSAKRQEKLSNMLKDLLGAKKLRDEAKSAVPDILQGAMQSSTSQLQQQQQEPTAAVKPPTLFAGLVHHVKNNTSPYHKPGITEVVSNGTPLSSNANVAGSAGPDCRSFAEKYGRCQEVIGRGSFGVVRISHKKVDSSPTEKLFAVKEFKRRPNESEKKYNRRLTSEFCISSSLKHNNIIDTLDLLKDAKGDYCEVMEFCSGGDLYTLIIAAGKLEYAEADCFFKQLIRGVNYMHDMGVAHRDLKPENLLLTQNGALKITDFGNSECFRMAWEKDIQYSDGICGSSPYIAPEEYDQDSFDPRCVDIWSCGVIYMAMRTGRQLWKLADPKQDEFFEEYLVKRKESTGYEPIESLKRARCRNVIYSILDPKPERRITGKQILNSEWGREIKVCEAGEGHSHE